MLYTEVTGEQLIAATRLVASRQPDKVVSRCQYSTGNGKIPVCLIGHAFHELQVPLSTLPNEPIDVIMGETGMATVKQTKWLEKAQLIQDSEFTWAEAIASADAAVAKMEEIAE